MESKARWNVGLVAAAIAAFALLAFYFAHEDGKGAVLHTEINTSQTPTRKEEPKKAENGSVSSKARTKFSPSWAFQPVPEGSVGEPLAEFKRSLRVLEAKRTQELWEQTSDENHT